MSEERFGSSDIGPGGPCVEPGSTSTAKMHCLSDPRDRSIFCSQNF